MSLFKRKKQYLSASINSTSNSVGQLQQTKINNSELKSDQIVTEVPLYKINKVLFIASILIFILILFSAVGLLIVWLQTFE